MVSSLLSRTNRWERKGRRHKRRHRCERTATITCLVGRVRAGPIWTAPIVLTGVDRVIGQIRQPTVYSRMSIVSIDVIPLDGCHHGRAVEYDNLIAVVVVYGVTDEVYAIIDSNADPVFRGAILPKRCMTINIECMAAKTIMGIHGGEIVLNLDVAIPTLFLKVKPALLLWLAVLPCTILSVTSSNTTPIIELNEI